MVSMCFVSACTVGQLDRVQILTWYGVYLGRRAAVVHPVHWQARR